MRVKLHWLSVSLSKWNEKKLSSHDERLDYGAALGSGAKMPGDSIEGMIVPENEVWLFPTGDNFARIEKVIQGKRNEKIVNIS